MKTDVASIKSKFLRRSYLIAVSPFAVVVFTIIAVCHLIKYAAVGMYRAVTKDFTEDAVHNGRVIALAFHYNWIGKEEYERRQGISKVEKVNRLLSRSTNKVSAN